MMKKFALSSLAIALMASSATVSAVEFSGNVGATSDYLWRGLSQTDGKPAVSGGLDMYTDAGFYAGTWASNIDFGDDATYEIDFYAGYYGEIGDFFYDVGYNYYAYPNGEDLDFGEVYGSVGWNWLGLNVFYATNESASEDYYKDSFYVEGTAAFDLSDSLSLGFAIGHQSFDIDDEDDYITYNVSLTKSTDLGDVAFMVSDTDLDDDDPIVLVSWTYEFDL
ncbi:TorF family putative porin [Ferrimonas balearica]|uniref:TorF family putative porin n=2 Tax=Ferrimonas balearica TaxID=44012 RepID=UPI001FEF889B|nr:TorF family putative porin [Ferrimonas balearica]